MLRLGLGHWYSAALRVDSANLGQELFVFGRIPPLGVPVQSLAISAFAAFCGGLQDKFCDILRWRAVNSTISEIPDDSAAFLAHGAKVERVTTRIEREDHVEMLNQD